MLPSRLMRAYWVPLLSVLLQACGSRTELRTDEQPRFSGAPLGGAAAGRGGASMAGRGGTTAGAGGVSACTWHLGPQAIYAAGVGPSSIAAGDLDGDRDLDLVVGNINAGTVSILLNNGRGVFAAPKSYAVAQPSAVAVADVDGDGRPEVETSDG